MNLENLKQYFPQKQATKLFNDAVVFEVAPSQIEAITFDLRNNKELALKFVTATDDRESEGCFKVWYVFGSPEEHAFIVPYIRLKDTKEFPSISNIIHEAWSYERKIMTFFGLVAVGHPDQRPIILHENWPKNEFPLRKDFALQTKPEIAHGEYSFQEVGGEGIYEIPVGPIHAGIIEPGHFRFSVAGEEIVLLEPRLGYVHKGSEKLFENLSTNEMIRLSEKISGDSSFSHSLAFCQVLEQLSDATVPVRAKYLRVIFAELERLANHFGDVGAIMLDSGFSFGGAQGARLREIIMRINERLTGSRFLRGVNICGGVTKDINNEEKEKLFSELVSLSKDFAEVMSVVEDSASLLNRLKNTGILPHGIAADCGVTGIAAKALGIENDTRVDYPYAAYNELSLEKIVIERSGDVYARFRVRVREIFASIEIIKQSLNKLTDGAINSGVVGTFKKDAVAISVVEGWRGEILYFVTTDSNGKITRVAPRDPSVINWPLVGYAVLHNIVPDFPLVNKSFNLSYSGNDL